jgi:hypothetical protein
MNELVDFIKERMEVIERIPYSEPKERERAIKKAWDELSSHPKICSHEFVSVQYLSQPYGHCESCKCTVVKSESGSWRLP